MKMVMGTTTPAQTRNVSQSVACRVVGMTWVINAVLHPLLSCELSLCVIIRIGHVTNLKLLFWYYNEWWNFHIDSVMWIHDTFPWIVNCMHKLLIRGPDIVWINVVSWKENFVFDDTKQVCQVGNPSAECCSKSKFSPRGNSGFISNSRGIVEKAPLVLLRATCKIIPRSCVPNSTEWLSSTRCECK
jgi:hypothetical protein